jgi:hypothetical protein
MKKSWRLLRLCFVAEFLTALIFGAVPQAFAFGMFPTQPEWLRVRAIVATELPAKRLMDARIGDAEQILRTDTIKNPADLQTLAYVWRFTNRADMRAALQRHLLTYMRETGPSGNPLQDGYAHPAMVAAQQARGLFSSAEQAIIDRRLLDYVRAMREWRQRNPRQDNWAAWAVATAGLAAVAADHDASVQWAAREGRLIMDASLRPDGSSEDFHYRDSLAYHMYHLTPLLTLAQALKVKRIDLYNYRTQRGSGLQKALAFMLPYASGREQHLEFVNSQFEPDKTSLHADKLGKPWSFGEGGRAFLMADAFDGRWGDLDRAVKGSGPYPDGITVYLLNRATRDLAP